MLSTFWVPYFGHEGNGLLETFLSHHGNIPMKMIAHDIMRLLRERSLKLWEHVLLAGRQQKHHNNKIMYTLCAKVCGHPFK
jgi:hypothetical protein